MKPSLARLRIEHLWTLAALAGIFIFVNTHPIRPNDFWFHIATGREALRAGRIPLVDDYSFTRPGAPYPSNSHYWLMQVTLYGAYVLGGEAGVVLLASILVTAAYAVVWWAGLRASGSWRAAALGAIFAAALGVDNWNVRPQLIAYLCAAVYLLAIHEYRTSRRRRWLALFPLLMLIWVNSHGTFFVGLALLAFWNAEAAWQTLRQRRDSGRWDLSGLAVPLAALGLTLAASLLNPQGLGTLGYLQSMSASPVTQGYIVEWQPQDPRTLTGLVYLAGLLGGALALAGSPRRPRVFEALCFLFFGLLGLRYGRAAVWYGLCLAPTVAEAMGARLEGWRRAPAPGRAQPLTLALAGLLAGLAFLSLPWFKAWWPVQPEKVGLAAPDTPVQATAFLLDSDLPQPIFNELGLGSYLIWAAYPRYRVFVDPRFELYPETLWNDYLQISTAATDWEARLGRYGVQTLFLNAITQPRLVEAAQRSAHWHLRYQDSVALIFTRR